MAGHGMAGSLVPRRRKGEPGNDATWLELYCCSNL